MQKVDFEKQFQEYENFSLFNLGKPDWKRFRAFFDHLIPSLIILQITKNQKFKVYSVSDKEQVLYLCKYLEKLQVTHILVEKYYIDRIYINDFTEYHLTAFPHYKKTCSRLHFFAFDKKDIDAKKFLNKFIITRDPKLHEEFKDHYRGFSVIKPLPNIFIGRTCVVPPSDSVFFLRRYSANIFGRNLEIKSLVFQEQDPTVGACASISLWSALHCSSEIFNNITIPSPSQITKIAESLAPTTHRIYPSHGLNAIQMVSVIKHAGLAPEYLDLYHPVFQTNLKSIIYGYCSLHVPGILLVYLRSRDSQKENRYHTPDHAIVITGFNMMSQDAMNQDEKFQKRANKITSLYIHDDNGGPFLDCEISNENQKFNDKNISMNILKIKRYCNTQYLEGWDEENKEGYEIAEICGIIFPLYKKIRIDLSTILLFMTRINTILNNYLRSNKPAKKIEWDIHLTTVNKYKDFLNKQDFNKEIKQKLLLGNFPRFMWRCTGYIDNGIFIDVLFDATDLLNALYINEIYFYNDFNLKRFSVFLNKEKEGILKILESKTHYVILKDKISKWLEY